MNEYSRTYWVVRTKLGKLEATLDGAPRLWRGRKPIIGTAEQAVKIQLRPVKQTKHE